MVPWLLPPSLPSVWRSVPGGVQHRLHLFCQHAGRSNCCSAPGTPHMLHKPAFIQLEFFFWVCLTMDCGKGALETGGLFLASVKALVSGEPLPKLPALRTARPSGPTLSLGPVAWKHCRLGAPSPSYCGFRPPPCTCLNQQGPLTYAELLEPLLQLLFGDTPAARWPA